MGIALGWGLKRLGTAPGWEMSGDGNWELPGMGTGNCLGWELPRDGNPPLMGTVPVPAWIGICGSAARGKQPRSLRGSSWKHAALRQQSLLCNILSYLFSTYIYI